MIKQYTGYFACAEWKKRRDGGVGILVKVDKNISADDPDVNEQGVMALNMTINGFKLWLVNGYAPTDCDGTENQKNEFYRTLRKACEIQNETKNHYYWGL